MAVLKYSDLVDSGLFVKTSTKGQANGVASLGSDGKVLSSQLPTSSGGTTTSDKFTFRVNFSDGNVASAQDLPTGWSVSVSAPNVVITHNTGTYPKIITYLGYNSDVNPAILRYRVPTAANEMFIVDSTKTNMFTFMISSAVAAASSNGYALVTVSF